MLNVTVRKDAASTVAYLSEEGDNYYTNDREDAGIWHGKGAQALGLSGEVNPKEFKLILSGFSPDGSKKLAQGAGRNHRAGWDCTFSAPKKLSILAAILDEQSRQKIESAHKKAVAVALDHIEANLAQTRRGKSGKNLTKEKVARLVASQFLHATSRANDPQLHTHAFIANVVQRDDGTWGTLDAREIYRHKVAIDQIYQAELGRELNKLGIETERNEQNKSVEVVGVSDEVCEEFSQRRQQIKKELDRLGLKSGGKATDRVALATRAKKTHEKNKFELQQDWIERATAKGFSPSMARKLFGSIEPPEPQHLNKDAILKRLIESQATFTEADLWQAVAAEAQISGAGYEQIKEAVNEVKLEQEVVIVSGQGDEIIYSTRAQITYERGMIEGAQRMATQIDHNLLQNEIDSAIQKIEQKNKFEFSEEQKKAIESSCKSSFAITQGSAGAGKTALLSATSAAYQNRGYQVIGSANSAAAATVLKDDLNINCFTNAKLIQQLKNGQLELTNKSVLIIDEAGMASTREIETLRRATERAGGKIILSGEDKQFDAVQHGGALKTLSQEVGCARVETIIRQDEQWNRDAIVSLRDGKAAQAIAAYEERDLINFAKNRDETKSKLISDWQKYNQENPDKDSVIIAQRNDDVKEIGQIIRQIRKDEGLVGNEDVKLKCSASAKNFSFEFSQGDKIKFCKNDERGIGVINGTRGTIKKIKQLDKGDAQITVQTDDRGEITFNASDYKDQETNRTPIILGYAMTGHASQGMTVKGESFIFMNGTAGRAGSYVPASRATGNSNFYFSQSEFENRAKNHLPEDHKITRGDLLNEVAKSMNRDNRKKLAIDYIAEQREEAVNVQREQEQRSEQKRNQERQREGELELTL